MGRFIIRGILAAVIAIVIVLMLSSASRAQGNGEKLYNANKCASCHGADGSANVPAGKALKAHDFHSPEVQAKSNAELTAEIAELVAYSRALGKK